MQDFHPFWRYLSIFFRRIYFSARPVKIACDINLFLHFYQDTLMEGYFPFCDCSSLREICPTQDEPSCIELKDPDDLYLVNCNVLTYCWKINKSWTKNSCHFILNGLSINTYYSIIIVISCTLMINKVTQTPSSSMHIFPTNAVYSLKSFISAMSNVNF